MRRCPDSAFGSLRGERPSGGVGFLPKNGFTDRDAGEGMMKGLSSNKEYWSSSGLAACVCICFGVGTR